MANILASVSVVLGAEIGEFKAKMAEARKELRGLVQFAEGLKDVGQSLTTFVTLPLLALGGAGIKMAGDLEKATASFTTLLGSADAAKKTLGELTDFARETPFELPEIQDAARKLLAFNTPANELKETLRQLGDVSAGVDAPISSIAELFGKARVQGRLFAEDINQLTGRGIPVIQEFAKQFGVTDSEVKKLVESGKIGFPELQKAFAALTGEGGKFSGLMEKQSATIPGLFSSLKDAVGQSLAGIGADIVAAIDLKGVIKDVTNFVQSVATAFAGLSPEVKKFIVVGAGLALALGPALIAFGALAAALPAVIAGFTLLAGPIGIAVAAIAALGVGIALVASSSKDATTEFRAQGASVKSLSDTVNPLLKRYDELKAKTNLTKTEQEELRGIIEKVGAQIPGSITAFDNYGRALDLNSEKAREFVKTQQLILAVKNKEAIQQQRESYRELTGEIQETINALGTFDAKGNVAKLAPDEDGYPTYFALTNSEILKLQGNLTGLQNTRAGVEGLINELEGILPVVEKTNKAGGIVPPVTPLVSATTKAEVDKVLLALQKLNEGYDAIGARRILKVQETPDFKLDLPKDTGPPLTLLGIDNSAFLASLRVTAQEAAGFNEKYAAATAIAVGINEQFTGLLQQGIAAAAEGIGQALGGVLSGTLSIADGLTAVFGQVLGTMGGFIVEFGKMLIQQAVLTIAATKLATNPVTAPAAIALGIAAIAVGSALKSLASGGPFGRGGGGGGGGSPSFGGGGSTTRPGFSPTQAPGLTNGPGGPNNITHKIEFTLPGHLLTAALAYETERSGRLVPRR